MERDHRPAGEDLSGALGRSFVLWEEIRGYVSEHCPEAYEEWNFSKLGWNCRLRDRKRVIVYLMPCERFFRASLVLGRKAVAEARDSNISEEVKAIISAAKTYAEGTGVRIDVKTKKTLGDIKTLVAIKLRS